MSKVTALQVMRKALQQYHYTESPPGSNMNKFGKAYGYNGVAWCAEYVWWCGWIAAGKNNELNPFYKNANAADIQDLTVRHKGGKYILKRTSNNTKKKAALPKIKFGDSISFNFSGGNSRQHTGLIVGVWGNYIYCIEGNTSLDDRGSQSNGGAVALRKRYYTTDVCTVRADYKSFKWHTPKTPYTGEIPKLPALGYFKYGDSGKNVGRLQTALAWANGYDLAADKEFKGMTFAEVVIFQVANGLEPDGKFGERCLAKLDEIVKKHSKASQTEADKLVKRELFMPTQGDLCYDLSDHQGKLSVEYFKDIKAKGVKCVILRSSYTKLANPFRMFKDAHFDNNIKNAIKAGMHIGIYHFSQAKTDAEAGEEYEFCHSCIKPYIEHIDLPVGIDTEFGRYKDENGKWHNGRLTSTYLKSIGKTKFTKTLKVFCNKAKADGFEPMIYASLTFFNNYVLDNIYKDVKIWVAQYYDICQYKHPHYMWQYTSSNGKLDKNKFGSQGTKKKTDSILPDRGYFRIGDKGSGVKKAQQMLNKALAGAHWSIPENGAYDEVTADYVKLLEDVRHITIDGEFGEQCLKQCEKTVTLQMKACNRAVSICRDNAYVYGVGERAHRYGDPFSGTNVGPIRKIKEKKGEPHYVDKHGKKWTSGKKYTYANTMCCNVFATVAYGYGAAIKAVKDALKKGSGFGTSPDKITRYGFEDLGKLKQHKFDDIKKGDVICISSKGKLKTAHAFICTGGDWFAEAGTSGWGPETIAHKKGLKKRFEKYQVDDTAHLLRYPKK